MCVGGGFSLDEKAFACEAERETFLSRVTYLGGGGEKQRGRLNTASHSCNAKNADARRRGRPICEERLPTSYYNVNNKTHKEPWRKSSFSDVVRNPPPICVSISRSATHQ